MIIPFTTIKQPQIFNHEKSGAVLYLLGPDSNLCRGGFDPNLCRQTGGPLGTDRANSVTYGIVDLRGGILDGGVPTKK